MALGVMRNGSVGQLNMAAMREVAKDIIFFDVGSETQMLYFNSFCIEKCFKCSELIEMKFYILKIKIRGFRSTNFSYYVGEVHTTCDMS